MHGQKPWLPHTSQQPNLSKDDNTISLYYSGQVSERPDMGMNHSLIKCWSPSPLMLPLDEDEQSKEEKAC